MAESTAEMLEEEGVVVAVEGDALWVETIQHSTCGGCRARSGCGQRVLAGVLSNATRLRVVVGPRAAEAYHPGQRVVIGIPADVVVASSLLLYLAPLLAMLGAAALTACLGGGDYLVALAGALGLLGSGALLRYLSWRLRNHARLQPVLLGMPTLMPYPSSTLS